LEKDHSRPLKELVPVAQASWPALWGRPPGLRLPDQSALLARSRP
jgi:hypothetical protein